MKKNRRIFFKEFGMLCGSFALSSFSSSVSFLDINKFNFKISLAQWSLHKSLFSNKITTLDFPVKAKKDFNIEAVEYVNQFFSDKAKDKEFLQSLKKRSEDNGVKNLLIMIDQEGELANTETSIRKKAIENHYKWIEAAQFLGCHSIRVNLHGKGSSEDWKNASIESLGKLSEFGALYNVNVLVENHGGYSSNGKLLSEVIQKVNNPYCGTLPDFGNFCSRRAKGDLWESPCVEWYDKYKGVEEMLPFAHGVSAKTFAFDKAGNETTIDYLKMLKLVKSSGYEGYIGIEYEGSTLSENEGIIATKNLLEKIREQLSK